MYMYVYIVPTHFPHSLLNALSAPLVSSVRVHEPGVFQYGITTQVVTGDLHDPREECKTLTRSYIGLLSPRPHPSATYNGRQDVSHETADGQEQGGHSQ